MSDWKLRGIKRRDERATKAEVRAPTSNKKNTKKWCRGVVGREHVLACRDHHSLPNWKELACTKCGKVLDYWCGPTKYFTWLKDKPKPAWVT